MYRKLHGFTILEIVLIIAILGVLGLVAVPSFINVSTQARQAERDITVGAVRSGIALFHARDRVENGPPGRYPTKLDAAKNESSAKENPLFMNILEPGIVEKRWTKISGTQYSYNDGRTLHIYSYTPETGAFASPTAP